MALQVTFIDGEKGELLYRGYPIEELAEKADFLDCAFVLMHGELPDAAERAQFRALLRSHRLCHEHLIRFYRGACGVAQLYRCACFLLIYS